MTPYKPEPWQCQCCGEPLPADLLELGGKYCSLLCEHIVTKCGSTIGRCIVCGEPVPAHTGKRVLCLNPECKRQYACRSSIYGRRLEGSPPKWTIDPGPLEKPKPNRDPILCARPACKNEVPPRRTVYCSNACLVKDSSSRARAQQKLVRSTYSSSVEQREKFYDDAVRKGVWSLEFEVELIFAEASTLRGTHDQFLRNKLHVEGPEEPTPMKNLHVFRKEAREEDPNGDEEEGEQ